MANFEIVNVPSIIPELLKLCPGIEIQWQQHLDSWGDMEPGEYNDSAEIVHFVVNSYLEDKTEFFPKFFSKVENFVNSTYSSQKEIACLGILETLQIYASNQDCGYQPFEKWLEKSSFSEWRQLEVLWSDKESLMDVIRSGIHGD